MKQQAGHAWSLLPGPIIAHRGASGRLPEHTLEAYAYAHGVGADWIEPDVVASRDGVLICLHDVVLERVTNVAEVYPSRKREDGAWYVWDFSLAELKALNVQGPARDARGFQLCTLEELLQLMRHLEKVSGRMTGICPELKRPSAHRAEGLALEEPFLAMMDAYGYDHPQSHALVQCFELDCLQRLRKELKSTLPLLLLTEDEALDEDQLRFLGTEVDAIGPHREAIEASDGKPNGGADWVSAVHAAGLKVVPYTFDDEPAAMRRFLKDYRVDAVFTNYPSDGVKVRSTVWD